MDYLLKMVNSPEDLRKIPVRKLPMLCHEIREKIISAVSDNGGHLASNLGGSGTYGLRSTVYLLPNDAIVWDGNTSNPMRKNLNGKKTISAVLRTKDGIPVIQNAIKANTMRLMLVMPALLFLLLWVLVRQNVCIRGRPCHCSHWRRRVNRRHGVDKD